MSQGVERRPEAEPVKKETVELGVPFVPFSVDDCKIPTEGLRGRKIVLIGREFELVSEGEFVGDLSVTYSSYVEELGGYDNFGFADEGQYLPDEPIITPLGHAHFRYVALGGNRALVLHPPRLAISISTEIIRRKLPKDLGCLVCYPNSGAQLLGVDMEQDNDRYTLFGEFKELDEPDERKAGVNLPDDPTILADLSVTLFRETGIV
jgi:hypothetical protein